MNIQLNDSAQENNQSQKYQIKKIHGNILNTFKRTNFHVYICSIFRFTDFVSLQKTKYNKTEAA